MRPRRTPTLAARLAPLLCLLLLLVGCSGLEENRRNSNFGLQNLSYEKALRWGEYKTAAAYIKPGVVTEPIDFADYDQIQVTDYRGRHTSQESGGNKVTLEVRISYLRKNTVSVRNLDQTLVWEYDESTERWWLLTPLPKFE